jgi:hypothetical protein
MRLARPSGCRWSSRGRPRSRSGAGGAAVCRAAATRVTARPA